MLSPNFIPFPDIVTERVLLRQLKSEDAPAVMRLRSNEEVMRYINRPLTKTIEEAQAWIGVVQDNLEKNNGINWCICLRAHPGQHIGNIGLWRIEKENYRAEIGYMLEPDFQGKGIMFEALRAVVDYGFQVMGLHSIEAHLDPRNLASAALLRKGGFLQEAYFRENYFSHGEFADTAVYSLLKTHHKQGPRMQASVQQR